MFVSIFLLCFFMHCLFLYHVAPECVLPSSLFTNICRNFVQALVSGLYFKLNLFGYVFLWFWKFYLTTFPMVSKVCSFSLLMSLTTFLFVRDVSWVHSFFCLGSFLVTSAIAVVDLDLFDDYLELTTVTFS